MRILSLASLVLVTSLASSVSAQDRDENPWYLTFNIGAAFPAEVDENPTGTVGYDTGIATALAVGRRLSDSDSLDVAAELEGLYAFSQIDEGDLDALPATNSPRDAGNLAWFLNGVLEWNFSKTFAWYGGAGIGYATGIELEAFDFGDLDQADKDALAFQFKLGAVYRLGGNVDFLLGYRYYQTEDIQVDNIVSQSSFDITNQINVVELGMRWGL
jgi:opacity protein-like surface antigen